MSSNQGMIVLFTVLQFRRAYKFMAQRRWLSEHSEKIATLAQRIRRFAQAYHKFADSNPTPSACATDELPSNRMIRIILAIDGREVAATTIHPSALTAAYPQGPTEAADQAAPPEILAAAAAVGALSAGPAPSGVPMSSLPMAAIQRPSQFSTADLGAYETTDAGAAPTG
jgi:hypothetical protein